MSTTGQTQISKTSKLTTYLTHLYTTDEIDKQKVKELAKGSLPTEDYIKFLDNIIKINMEQINNLKKEVNK